MRGPASGRSSIPERPPCVGSRLSCCHWLLHVRRREPVAHQGDISLRELVTDGLHLRTDVGAGLPQYHGQLGRVGHRNDRIDLARGDQHRHAREVRMRRIRKRCHRPEKRHAGQRAGTQQYHGCRDACGVGIAERDWTIEAVSAPRRSRYDQTTSVLRPCRARSSARETLRACRESSIAVIACLRGRMFVPMRSLEI
jgi:hypothetical protein